MFLVCGEALFDLFASEGERGLSFDARIGGSPFNVAVGLARLGEPSALLTGLSTDRLGGRLVDALRREGVAADFLARSDRPTTLSLVDVGPDGGPVYSFYGEGTADRAVGLDDLPKPDAEFWGLHLGSYSLVVKPVGECLMALAEREAGRRLVTLDPNVRLNVERDLDLWRARIDRALAAADVVKVSIEDLEHLYPGEEVAGIARRWRAAGPALVVVTRGAEGAEAFASAGRIEVPARRVEVVDTVGAGDTFMAALIAGLAGSGARARAEVEALGRTDLEALLARCIAAAAITCSRRGADLPRKAELEEAAPAEG